VTGLRVRRGLWTAALAGAVAVGTPPGAHAQAAQAPLPAGRNLASVPRGMGDRAATARDVATRTGVTLTPARPYPTAEPSSLRSMFIEIPAAVVARGGTFYFAEPGPWRSIGPRAGWLQPGDSVPLAYTLMVPALASAGENLVGLVRFVPTASREYYDVPLLVDVASRTQLTLEAEQPVLGARAGERLRTAWTIRNAGNADVEVDFSFSAASGWTVRPAAGGRIHVPRGSAVRVPVDLVLPADAGGGDYALVGTVRTPTGEASAYQQGVMVDGVARVGSDGVANVSLASVRDDGAADVRAFAVDFATSVGPALRLSGRFGAVSALGGGITANTLGGLGFTDRMRQLELRGDGWSLGGGNVGASVGGLGGVGLFGDGLVGNVDRRDWRGDVVALQPVFAEGRYLFGRGQRRFGDAWVGVLANDLSDGFFVQREARTLAVDVGLPTLLGQLDVQGGYRETTFGSGAALQLDLGHQLGPWSYSLSAGHVPGGASAFANAENTFTADVTRELGPRASVAGSLWGNADRARADREFASRGWSAEGRFAPRPALQLDAELRQNDWESRTTLGGIANGETSLGVGASWLRGAWQWRGGARLGSLRREAGLLTLGDVTTTARQSAFTLSGSRAFHAATLSATAGVERTGAGVGLPSQQMSFEMRAERIPLFSPRVYGSAEYGVFVLGATGARLDAQSLGVDVELPGALGLRIEANRNALFRSAGTAATPWAVAVRLQRGLALPSASGRRVLGRVFVDENANGRFDRRERALPGVIVEVGGVPVTTDRDGRFRGPAGADVALDVRSLPPGLLVAPVGPGAGGADIAIVTTAPVDVVVRVENPERVPMDAVDVTKAIVLLQDDRGRVWSNVLSAEGRVRFDALPLGRYRVLVDASGAGEALVPLAALPTVDVTEDRRETVVTIILGPRPMRVQPLPAGRRIQLDGTGQREERRQ
jgi:hypothetical protein